MNVKDKLLKVIKSRKSIRTLAATLALVTTLNGCSFWNNDKNNELPVEPSIGYEQNVDDDHNHTQEVLPPNAIEDDHNHDQDHDHTQDGDDETNKDNEEKDDEDNKENTNPSKEDDGIPKNPVKFRTDQISVDENGHYVINGIVVPDLSKSSYKGVSISDALRIEGYKLSWTHMCKLAELFGIKNYRGTAKQNTYLLEQLRTWAIGLDLSQTQPIDPQGPTDHEHQWSSWVVVAPTCLEDGTMSRTCATCGEIQENAYVKALGHEFGNVVVTKPATCTEEGVGKETCVRCGFVGTTTLPSVGHDLTEEITKEPTCTEAGEKVISCASGDYKEVVAIPANGHNYGNVSGWKISEDGKNWIKTQTCKECGEVKIVESRPYTPDKPQPSERWGAWRVVKQATCTENGTEERVCITHKGLHVQTRDINALGHNITEWTPLTDWSEPDENNIQKRSVMGICSTCGHVEIKIETRTYIEEHTHSWSEWTTVKNPTCTEAGSQERTCACGEKETRVFGAALGHNLVEKVTKEPTCTETGILSKSCSRCDYLETEVIPALGHDYVWGDWSDWSTTPDENNQVSRTRTGICSVCHDTKVETQYKDYVPPVVEHQWGAWSVTTPATCEEKGVETRTCSVHGETETREIPALGHDLTETITKQPTCTEAGEKTITCSRGDYSETVTIPAKGHDWGEWTVVKEATAEENGLEERVCLNGCGEKENRVIPALGHNWSDWVVTKEATCTEAGERQKTCTDPGCTSVITETIPALGHQEKTTTIAATCTEDARNVVTCERCGKTLSDEPVPGTALGHDFTVEVIDKKPTCTEYGESTVTCSRCDASYKNYQEPLGHDYGEYTQTKAPSCTEEGQETAECSRCDSVISRAISKLSHIFKEISHRDATCTDAGETVEKCDNCNEQHTTTVDALGHDYVRTQTGQQNNYDPDTEELISITYTYTEVCSRCNDSKAPVTETVPVNSSGKVAPAVFTEEQKKEETVDIEQVQTGQEPPKETDKVVDGEEESKEEVKVEEQVEVDNTDTTETTDTTENQEDNKEENKEEVKVEEQVETQDQQEQVEEPKVETPVETKPAEVIEETPTESTSIAQQIAELQDLRQSLTELQTTTITVEESDTKEHTSEEVMSLTKTPEC